MKICNYIFYRTIAQTILAIPYDFDGGEQGVLLYFK